VYQAVALNGRCFRTAFALWRWPVFAPSLWQHVLNGQVSRDVEGVRNALQMFQKEARVVPPSRVSFISAALAVEGSQLRGQEAQDSPVDLVILCSPYIYLSTRSQDVSVAEGPIPKRAPGPGQHDHGSSVGKTEGVLSKKRSAVVRNAQWDGPDGPRQSQHRMERAKPFVRFSEAV